MRILRRTTHRYEYPGNPAAHVAVVLPVAASVARVAVTPLRLVLRPRSPHRRNLTSR